MAQHGPCCVYWLHDANCVCPWRHGYVGVTDRWPTRLREHRKSRKFPIAIDGDVLFIGAPWECTILEHKLRPDFNIGWNFLPGGIVNPVPLGTRRSDADRAAISKGVKAAGPLTPEQRARQIANTGRGKTHPNFGKPRWITNPQLGKNQNGERNPFFGKKHSEETRAKQRAIKLRDICVNGHPKEPGKGCRICNLVAAAKWRAKRIARYGRVRKR